MTEELGAQVLGLDSRIAYLALLGIVVVERLGELVISNRNLRRGFEEGAVEAGGKHYPWMVALHAAFLAACPLEVFLLDRPFPPGLAAAMFTVLVLAMGLRYWAIATLGDRWTTRVLVRPGGEPATGGPYRFVRHPNYLAVVLEVAALPLVHGAWLTAIVFSSLNAWMLQVRIRVEEQALAEHSAYLELLGDRPRLVPR